MSGRELVVSREDKRFASGNRDNLGRGGGHRSRCLENLDGAARARAGRISCELKLHFSGAVVCSKASKEIISTASFYGTLACEINAEIGVRVREVRQIHGTLDDKERRQDEKNCDREHGYWLLGISGLC